MRFLGWGIGHRNQPDFPHEANAVIASSTDRELIHRENSAATGCSDINEDEIGDGNNLSVDGGGDEDLDAEDKGLDVEHDDDEVLEFEYQY